jgi:hypothetical protein
VLAVGLAAAGFPFVVQALGDEAAPSTQGLEGSARVALLADGPAVDPPPALIDRPDQLTPAADPTAADPKAADPTEGWSAAATQQAQRIAVDAAALPTEVVEVPVLPPGTSASAWAALRDCESGGDYTITNPSGKYRGAYQFDRTTWDSVASRHDPALVGVDPAAASPAEQDAMAYALYTERGAQPWPHCGRHLR